MLKILLPAALLVLSAVTLLPQAAATETCVPPYDPSNPVNVCVLTGAPDGHCGTPITGTPITGYVCLGAKVQVTVIPVQVAINYEDALVCAYALSVNTCP